MKSGTPLELMRLPRKLFGAGLEAVGILAERVRRRMAVAGKRVTYPIKWDSPKQMRWFFATHKKLPYRRTNRHVHSYKVRRHPVGYTMSAKSPAGAIGGTTSGWQSRIHRDRWPNLLTVLFDELRKLPAELSNQMRVIGK